MHRINFGISAIVLMMILAAGPDRAAFADSLYPQDSTTSGEISMFSDTKAHKVGDVLTINVVEAATGNSTATTNASKNENANYGPGAGSILSLIRSFGLSGSLTSAATGVTNRSSGFTATISVIVKEVYPNGTMLVEGEKHVGINSEIEDTTFTGIVRQVDVTPENTVNSGQVANAEIRYSGKGPIGDKQHDGLVTKIFKFLF
jgi:flagellar L-ring protein precursor FlgH